jgi:hypothetical protein
MMFMLVIVMPGAVVVLRQVMVGTENVPTTPASIGEFVENFPAIVAPAHYA